MSNAKLNSAVHTLAVVGASGSGKSTLAQSLASRCQVSKALPDATLLTLDNYYKDLSHLSFAERDRLNFDHPSALDMDLFTDHVRMLSRGQLIEQPIYDFTVHSRTDRTELISPAPLLVIEGILLAAHEPLLALIDTLVFVDTPLELCLQRRIDRDVEQRNRSAASVREFWFDRAVPMFKTFGDPARSAADVVVDGRDDLNKMMTSLLDHLRPDLLV
ncbi:uridine kinase [Luminiphilus syltensis NOR5-1B]|uniref:uridine/cytidine kinase n=1 Tax=Luminiphilus syltensis NOR5-1B TaxID=565045 RepID=B8KS95_9GAMM|nr:uridine kinase [Luminiphilus syltensis]EED34138.1 uridine kinase [Luminiphilus syltensis NOR5-1B]